MIRRATLSLILLLAGFTAGLVITGRMRSATDSSAEALGPTTQASAPAKGPSTTPSLAPAGAPEFTRIASQAIKGVANISAVQIVRTPNSPFGSDPFFRYFFGSR